MTEEAAGSASGTSMTEIFECSGSLPAGGPLTGPHVGPGRSGYEETYTISLPFGPSAFPGQSVIVWAPQSV